MEESARATISAVVPLESKVIIVKLADDLHSAQLVQNLAEMVHVSQTIHVIANQDGLENCAIRINHGLDRLICAMLQYYLRIIH